MMHSTHNPPLISVVIPTYNYAGFLSKAVESVLGQTYKNFEIIIVDDGSTDNTRSLIKKEWPVRYFYQENKGVAAARNTGIEQSKGDYLVFLDADDWLQPDALEQNLLVIKDRPDVAFVSGNYYFLCAETNVPKPVCVSITHDHYTRLLQCNYIGMHATVMFQRWILNEFKFDEALKSCEDYDLYLNITRLYPVIHHQHFIATYYFHALGLSHNYEVMKDTISAVLQKQAPFIKSPAEKHAYIKGLQQWKDYDLLQKQTSLLIQTA